MPEVLPGDQTADGETPQDLGTKQAPVPVPEQPVEQAVTASPSAHIAPTLAVPTHTASATVNADRPGKLDARYRPWTLSAAELVAEEDSTDATTVDADRPGRLDARYRPWTLSAAELVAEEEKPVDEAPRPVVTTSPSAYGSPTSAGPVSRHDDDGHSRQTCKLDARYQRWTLRAPGSLPSRRSRLTNLPPLLTSARIPRPRFDPLIRRVTPKQFAAKRGDRRICCQLPRRQKNRG